MTDHLATLRVVGATLYFLPIRTRVPLTFGGETLTEVTCLRVLLAIEDASGRRAHGWGETPLSVQWVWPSPRPYAERSAALRCFSHVVGAAWSACASTGHPLEVGHAFLTVQLPDILARFNREHSPGEPLPWLAALLCCSAFDLALHDAYGTLLHLPVYTTYDARHLGSDLACFLASDQPGVSFAGTYPADYLVRDRPASLAAWHLVGGKDALDADDRDGSEPDDGYPILLREWIQRDGLTCLKVKLRGDDASWDMDRLTRVGVIAREEGVTALSADFNCTVDDPAYVEDILGRLATTHPRIYEMILYVEQPFPYDLRQHPIDVQGLAARKPLFLDESAHDWQMVRFGRSLGWTGVALKTCKTQTGALLSLCWAKAHKMLIMVQDLTNPMLAQIPHVLLAAHAGTLLGVETNSMQFYPEASLPEAAVHPGLYTRRGGRLQLGTIQGPGFGYRLGEMRRTLPPPAATYGSVATQE